MANLIVGPQQNPPPKMEHPSALPEFQPIAKPGSVIPRTLTHDNAWGEAQVKAEEDNGAHVRNMARMKPPIYHALPTEASVPKFKEKTYTVKE